MEFDWRRAVDHYGEALCAIAARLIVMAGIQAGRTAPTLPRHLYWRILALLRPAEFAARRLIAMAACKLDLKVPPPRPRGAAARDNAAPAGAGREPVGKPSAKTPAFALFDPVKRYGHPWLEAGDLPAPDDGDFRLAPPPGEPVDAGSLCRRVRTLADALSDLESQALRLARWRARRAAEIASCAVAGAPPGTSRVRPRRWSPLRPGRPPGRRRRPPRKVDELLADLHALALDALSPDTS